MPLPALIEVAPFSAEQLEAFRTTKSEIVIPGSKSITNRAIVLAALGDGEVTLRGALWSEDTEAMTDCMRRLGIDITVAADPDVDANRTITVRGCGGKLPNGGTEAEPLELFVQVDAPICLALLLLLRLALALALIRTLTSTLTLSSSCRTRGRRRASSRRWCASATASTA